MHIKLTCSFDYPTDVLFLSDTSVKGDPLYTVYACPFMKPQLSLTHISPFEKSSNCITWQNMKFVHSHVFMCSSQFVMSSVKSMQVVVHVITDNLRHMETMENHIFTKKRVLKNHKKKIFESTKSATFYAVISYVLGISGMYTLTS